MSSNGSDDRLESWKAIAGYLRRTERTARRWEKQEGLPVHRLSHHDRSSVYAFKAELDAWRAARSTDWPNGETDAPRGNVRHLKLALAISLFAVAATIGGYLWWRAPESPAASVPTLAVLPFAVDSADSETEHLGGAVAQSLVNQISLAPDLRVRPFATSMRNHRQQEEPAATGDRMGVDMVVTGHVEARGDELTINVSLVDVEPNMQVWGSSFATSFGELGALKAQIAQTLREEALRHGYGRDHPVPALAVTQRLSRNPQAVRHYLRGLGSHPSFSRSKVRYAIDEFRAAIELDPNFSAAHATLSVAYVDYSVMAEQPAAETMALARLHALRAVALDPQSFHGYQVLAAVSHWYDFNHELADRQFRRAIAAAPGNASVRSWQAEFMINMRRFDEAIAASRAAAERDPGRLAIDVVRGNALLFSGRPDEAAAIYRRALEIDPGHGNARYFLAQTYLAAKLYPEAVAEFARANEDLAGAPYSKASLAYGLARAGRRAEAEEMLHDFERRRKAGYYPAFTIAMANAGLGNHELALDWLERAADERMLGFYFPSVELFWDPLRERPRFQRLLERIGVPDIQGKDT